MPKHVFAYLCTKCNHLSHRHALIDDGDLRAGPYQCADCGCERPQDSPGLDRALDRAEFEAWKARR